MNGLKLRTLIFLLICTQIARAADPLDTWTWRNPLPSGSKLVAVAYGNGRYVALGSHGATASSPDGVNWVQGHPTGLPFGVTFHDLAYGNGQFVAVGWEWDYGFLEQSLVIFSSADGVSWVQRLDGPFFFTEGADSYRVAYGNGHFVAVGYNGTILKSGSIITLEITPNPSPGLLTLSVSGPTGLGYTIQKSTDLISWQIVTNISSVPTGTVTFETTPASVNHEFYRAYSQ
jgi:hypothetical protein